MRQNVIQGELSIKIYIGENPRIEIVDAYYNFSNDYNN